MIKIDWNWLKINYTRFNWWNAMMDSLLIQKESIISKNYNYGNNVNFEYPEIKKTYAQRIYKNEDMRVSKHLSTFTCKVI